MNSHNLYDAGAPARPLAGKAQVYRVAFLTILIREIRRFLRIWKQTLLPSVITTFLYFTIFGNLIGNRIGEMDGIPYISFIVPGLIMMSVITNSFGNVVSSFFGSRFQKNIEEMLTAPLPPWVIIAGFVAGGAARGLCVAVIVTAVSAVFTPPQVHHAGLLIVTVVMCAILFAQAGLINALFAKNFDDINIIPMFILTPLTYLGGVFYSIKELPVFWQGVSKANPLLYMINSFRYAMLGKSDVDVSLAQFVIFLANVILFAVSYWLIRTSRRLKE